MGIEVLPDHVVAQIAAGEVVERPASVVKELIENAIDAGAATIHVSVSDGGQRLIRVSDDGGGIYSQEVELAFSRHATSKLRSHDDLQRIATLGFRGEALFSIASVSRVTVTTRHRDEQTGIRLRLEGSVISGRQAIGAPSGTIITVENLFYNVPARLKFLKKVTTERKQITTLVMHFAMAYPHIRFILEHDGREVFRASGSGQLADVMVKALGLEIFKNLIEVNSEHQAIVVQGYTSDPSLVRSDRGRITLFVNGRAVQDSHLTYAITQAYQGFLESNQYPIAVLMVRVPSEDVDVNVHPTKAEVRFRDNNQVFTAVQRAVREALVEDANRRGAGGHFAPLDYPRTGGQYEPPWARQMGMALDTESAPVSYERGALSQSSQNRGDDTTIPYGPGAPLKPRTLPVLRVIGQVGASYIVAEGPAGLYLIDQHAAHQRVLYEQFLERGERPKPINDVVTVELSATRARLLETYLKDFTAVGFAIEPFGTHTFVVRAAPALLPTPDVAQIIIELVDELAQKRPAKYDIEAFLIQQIVRRSAVKVGQILNHEEMEGLVRQLERSQNPLTSPEGRSTLLHMSGDQLAREFGR